MSTQGETRRQKHAVPIPEPVPLWKWAARNSRRHGDGRALGLVDFYKRSGRAVDRRAGEPHGEFAKRALLTETRKVLAARRLAGGNIPVWIEELLASEIAQKENVDAVETRLR